MCRPVIGRVGGDVDRYVCRCVGMRILVCGGDSGCCGAVVGAAWGWHKYLSLCTYTYIYMVFGGASLAAFFCQSSSRVSLGFRCLGPVLSHRAFRVAAAGSVVLGQSMAYGQPHYPS